MSKSYAAFFDVDETIINCKTMFHFLKFFFIKNSNPILGTLKYNIFKMKLNILKALKISRSKLNKNYYRCFKGSSKQFLMDISKEWFSHFKQEMSFNNSVVRQLKQHQEKGAKVVFVSGSFMPCLKPIAEILNVNEILAIQLEEAQGILTGNLLAPQTIGKGKTFAMMEFLENHPEIELKDCYAYGDHSSDLPMLKKVGNPVAVGQNETLIKHAKKNGWTILDNNTPLKESLS